MHVHKHSITLILTKANGIGMIFSLFANEEAETQKHYE